VVHIRGIENIECAFIAGELATLCGKRVSNFYRVAENSYRLRLGDVQVSMRLPKSIAISKYGAEAGKKTGFEATVARELDGQRLEIVQQVNNDRIIKLVFGRNTLMVELFSDGNIVLCDAEMKIVDALIKDSWKDRTIARGKEYSPPPERFSKSLSGAITKKYVISAMLEQPFGKEYSKEALARCGIPEKTPGTELTPAQVAQIEGEIEGMRGALAPRIFIKDGKPVGFGLCAFSSMKDCVDTPAATLSEAVEECMENGVEREDSPGLLKLQRRLEEQKARRIELAAEEENARACAEYVYLNYAKVEGLLVALAKAGVAGAAAVIVKAGFRVEKLDGKTKTIEIELE
jgi:predicted ribosome quality control (RQC) complex YloA/Tae2 family protein